MIFDYSYWLFDFVLVVEDDGVVLIVEMVCYDEDFMLWVIDFFGDEGLIEFDLVVDEDILVGDLIWDLLFFLVDCDLCL